MVVVSEFMNPPLCFATQVSENDKSGRCKRLFDCKDRRKVGPHIAASYNADGIVSTNECVISSNINARRHAMTYDGRDIPVWKNHLCKKGIPSISPGFLFIHTRKRESEQNENGLKLQHELVPKTEHGSIWTPHNHVAVEFTRDMLLDFFR